MNGTFGSTPNFLYSSDGSTNFVLANNTVLYSGGQYNSVSTLNQGSYMGWNYSGNQGETNFMNVSGTGPGGWYFYNIPGVQGTGPGTLIYSITPSQTTSYSTTNVLSGNLTVNGAYTGGGTGLSAAGKYFSKFVDVTPLDNPPQYYATPTWAIQCTTGGIWLSSPNGSGLSSDPNACVCGNSDVRIKKGVEPIHPSIALAKVCALDPVTFYFTHQDERRVLPNYGFIAQETTAIIPQAVLMETEVVPTVNRKGIISRVVPGDAWEITMPDPHNLEEQEPVSVSEIRVVLLAQDDITEECITAPYEIKDECTIRILSPPEKDHVFEGQKIHVEGPKVRDFHVMNKEPIFILGISAIQELAKRVETLTEENQQLRSRLERIETYLDAEMR